MKTILKFRFLIMVLIVGSFLACKKTDSTPVKLSTSDMAQRLYTQKDFVDFAGSFAKNFKYLANYYQSPTIINSKDKFIQSIKKAGDDQYLLQSAHANFGLDINEILIRKNRLDNDILHLYNAQPELLNYTEEEYWSIIKQSVLLLKKSNSVNTIKSNSSDINAQSIALDEIWDCLVGAAGLGTAGILTIAGIKELAKKGFQNVVIHTAAFLARHAGYVFVAIAVLDFTSCMYRESQD
jgi:hypothetical protein